MNQRRRTFVSTLAAAGLSQALPAVAQGNIMRMVVPLTPGTTPDLIARVISPVLQERLAMSIIVENRPGASGMIGMSYVAQSADPGTLLVVPATTVTLPMFYKQVDFDVLHAFTPITQAASSSFVLVVANDVPATNLPEFIAWAKSKPDAFYASPGNGTHHHLFMEMLKQQTGIRLQHVPYKGSAPAVNDLMGGQIPTMFLPIQVAVPLRDAGHVKIIGGSLRYRHPGFPGIPSLHEQGATNYHADPWFSIWGSPKIPRDLAEKYRLGIVAALDQSGVKENLTKQGLILKTSTAAELQARTKEESDLWAGVIRRANIQPA